MAILWVSYGILIFGPRLMFKSMETHISAEPSQQNITGQCPKLRTVGVDVFYGVHGFADAESRWMLPDAGFLLVDASTL